MHLKPKKENHSGTEQTAVKKKPSKKLIAIGSVALAVVLTLSIVLPVVLCKKDPSFKIPESKLPTEEKFALTKYDYDNLGDVQTTLRADTLNVVERNLARQTPEILSDDFSLVYHTGEKRLSAVYEHRESTAQEKVATIHFSEYTYPSVQNITTAYDEVAAAAGISSENYFRYFKYMLMTQGQHLALESQRRSTASFRAPDDTSERGEESLSGWLKKHPSADLQYGAVKGENNAVKKEITLDVLYRTYHTTGLYLPAGEVATVKVEGLKPGEKISVFVGLQNSLAWRGQISKAAEQVIADETGGIDLVHFDDAGSDMFFKKADIVTATGNFYEYGNDAFLQSQWRRQHWRAPWVTAEFMFEQNGEYEIGTPFGGIMHINPRNCYSPVKTTFTGAVETPHYILGVTTPEYFDEYLRDAPGVVGAIDTENGQLIGPTGETGTKKYMRAIKTDEADKLAMLWHSFFSVNESFTGGTYNRPNRVQFDWHVPAGAAVALGGYVYACPTDWFNTATNYRALLRGGTWGTLHEIGHNHASSYGTFWGFGDGKESEVHNNALTVLGYIMFCDTGTTMRHGGGVEHGFAANPYTSLESNLAINKKTHTDFSQLGYFEILDMYTNIMHSFGAEKYYELLYSYKLSNSYIVEGTNGNRRSEFAYRCSLIYGMNFVKYFNGAYRAGITDDMFSEEQLAFINSLPDYQPVANYYAGGIDGIKTGGDYCVTFGSPITFDLQNTTISTLDTDEEKGFKVISVGKPKHGKTKFLGDGKCVYTFDKNYTGTFDEFSFRVKMSDGVIHDLTITLRISYNGARVSTYTGIENPNATAAAMVDALEGQIAGKTPVYSNSTFAGVPSYNSKEWEVRIADFYWKAPVSGTVSLSISGSNGLCLYFGEDFENLTRTNLIYTAGARYNHPYEVTVEEGKYYAVRVFNTNRGGGGSATVGIADENGKYSAIPSDQIFHTDYPLGTPVPEDYVFEPQFIVSKKDNVKLSTTGTDKSQWQVLKAPEKIHGGRYVKQTMVVDPETGETSELTVDTWSYLIDGLTGTVLHTEYGGGIPTITAENPHEFVIDLQREQSINFFSVTTRNNVNSYITSYEMQIATTYDAETGIGNWKTVAEGDRNDYKGLTILKKFSNVNGRYLRLLVKSTTGGTFSVLAEIDAGIESQTQQVISSSSTKLYTTKGWKNTRDIASEPNGYMIAQKKNEKMVVKFHGRSIALYAATGEGYGTAKVYVDGKRAGTVVLDSGNGDREARKLVFYAENLGNKEHTVEIITQNSGKVMMNVLGIPYSANLVNAPNIYLERGLAISLAVFIVLFAAVVAVLAVLVFVKGFREKIFGSKVIQKLDSREKKPKNAKKKQKSSGKPVAAQQEKQAEQPAAEKPTAAEKTEKPVKKEKSPKAEPEKKAAKQPEQPEKAEKSKPKGQTEQKKPTQKKAEAPAEPKKKK